MCHENTLTARNRLVRLAKKVYIRFPRHAVRTPLPDDVSQSGRDKSSAVEFYLREPPAMGAGLLGSMGI